MKKYLLLPLLLLTLLPSCKKQDWLDWKAENEAWLAALPNPYPYVTGNDTVYFPVTTTSSGLKYCVIADPNPTDMKPSVASLIACDYSGRLINGYYFASEGSYLNEYVSSLVSGWQEGIQKIHSHGDIILFIPWDLGYGDSGSGTEGLASSKFIPPYSTLIFEIHLK